MESIPSSVAVLGLGRSGRATVEFLRVARDAGSAVEIVAYDSGSSESLLRLAREYAEMDVRAVLGTDAVDADFEVAVASPGIPPSSALLQSARARSRELLSEIEFAYRNSRSPWLAVTGTNGKTTTTSLVAHLLTFGGVPTECVGNIGDPAIAVVGEAGPSTAIVAEVSSFQLALTRTFHPRVAILLNITPDHIDWHGSLEAYSADKARVFANQGPDDVAVIDIDDSGSARYAELVESSGVKVIRVSRRCLPTGGAGLLDGMLVLDAVAGPLALVQESDLRIRGAHNVSNALAAAAAAHAWGVDPPSLRDGLRTFEPIAHRLEPVGVVDGVEYVNDSKGTNPAATMMALTAFAERPLVLLLGGRNKGSSFDELAQRAVLSAKTVIAFGEAAEEIAVALRAAGAEHVIEADMAAAFTRARAVSEPGDAVLLSPACASFDEFSSYVERGNVFRELVVGLSGEEGGDR